MTDDEGQRFFLGVYVAVLLSLPLWACIFVVWRAM